MKYSAIRKWFKRFILDCFKVLVVLGIIFATLCLNIIYLEWKQTYRTDKRMYINPLVVGIPYEEVNFQAEDGQEINGWFIPEKDAKTAILFCPGRTGNICDQLVRIRFLHNLGVNILMFDYRGYGANSGRPSEKGLYKDARAAYDYLISRDGVDKNRIIIFGESLGAAVAADLCLTRKAEALVLESPIVSLEIQARNLYPFLPVKLLLLEKYDTLSKIKKIRIPKLIVHGIDDEEIMFKEVLKLYYVAPSPKHFLPFNGAHDDDMYKISDEYKDQLKIFFSDNNISLQ